MGGPSGPQSTIWALFIPSIFPDTRAIEEKTRLSKGSKNFCPRAIHGDFFSGALEGVMIPKN